MIELFYLKKENYQKVLSIVEKDDLISRQSLNFKEASSLAVKKDGFFFKLSGTEEAVKKTKELLKDLVEEVKDKDQILKTIEEQEDQASAGFGAIFG